MGAEVINVGWQMIMRETKAIAARAPAGCLGVYGIPRGGVTPAVLVARELNVAMVYAPEWDHHGVLVVDDLVDSGNTAKTFDRAWAFDAMYRKAHSPMNAAPEATEVDGWLVFPWEVGEVPASDGVVRLLEMIGEDPTRDGLADTPGRVVKALREMCDGYDTDVAGLLGKTFDNGGDYDELIVCKGIEFTSLCEHHMLPFTGTATVGYIPSGDRIVGLSKLARLVDTYAHRLQVQERMTTQITTALVEHLDPLGAGAVVTAAHSCMACRGVRKQSAEMVTSSLVGVLREKPEARAEFLAIAGIA